MITRIRPTSRPVPGSDRQLHWDTDADFYPVTTLDRHLIRDTPLATFTQLIDLEGRPRGQVKAHASVAAALAYLGWEPIG